MTSIPHFHTGICFTERRIIAILYLHACTITDPDIIGGINGKYSSTVLPLPLGLLVVTEARKKVIVVVRIHGLMHSMRRWSFVLSVGKDCKFRWPKVLMFQVQRLHLIRFVKRSKRITSMKSLYNVKVWNFNQCLLTNKWRPKRLFNNNIIMLELYLYKTLYNN